MPLEAKESTKQLESYTVQSPNVLRDQLEKMISSLTPGQVLLILGPSGSGKSHILKEIEQGNESVLSITAYYFSTSNIDKLNQGLGISDVIIIDEMEAQDNLEAICRNVRTFKKKLILTGQLTEDNLKFLEKGDKVVILALGDLDSIDSALIDNLPDGVNASIILLEKDYFLTIWKNTIKIGDCRICVPPEVVQQVEREFSNLSWEEIRQRIDPKKGLIPQMDEILYTIAYNFIS